LSAFFAVTAVLIIVAWIGYTLATTPPPEPLEDFDDDLEDTTIEDTAAEDSEVTED
jgi:predicted DNA-binding transcriptional regulator